MLSVILCPACDLAHRSSAPPRSGRTRCARCDAILQHPQDAALDTAFALALCCMVLLFLANAYPLVAMQVNGNSRETTLLGATVGFYDQGYVTLAVLVAFTTFVGPVVQIATLLYILSPLRRGGRAPGQTVLIRLLTRVRHWSFIEVFMLGALVALVRLSKFAHVVPGTALWSSAALMLSMAALTSVTSPEQLWRWASRAGR